MMRRSRAEVDRYVSSLQASAPSPKEVSEGSYVGAAFVPKAFKGGRFRAVQLAKALPHVSGRADAAPPEGDGRRMGAGASHVPRLFGA